MKKFIVSAAVLLAGVMAVCAGQRVEIRSVDRVPLPEGVTAGVPTLSPSGDFVVMETQGSLQRVDVATGAMTRIVDTPHAFDVRISGDGSKVAYHEATYDGKLRYVSVKSADILTGKSNVIVKPGRNVSTGIAFSGNKVSAVEKNKVRSKALDKSKSIEMPVASINRGHLDISVGGTTTTIDPQGRGSYLWPSISPDGTKVVYWCAGKGCFVCDLDGSNPRPLGELRMAVWAGNDMVIGILDRDNGSVVTYSVLLASDLNGEKVQLTADDVISIAPSASADGKRVAYTTADGSLYLMTLEF